MRFGSQFERAAFLCLAQGDPCNLAFGWQRNVLSPFRSGSQGSLLVGSLLALELCCRLVWNPVIKCQLLASLNVYLQTTIRSCCAGVYLPLLTDKVFLRSLKAVHRTGKPRPLIEPYIPFPLVCWELLLLRGKQCALIMSKIAGKVSPRNWWVLRESGSYIETSTSHNINSNSSVEAKEKMVGTSWT